MRRNQTAISFLKFTHPQNKIIKLIDVNTISFQNLNINLYYSQILVDRTICIINSMEQQQCFLIISMSSNFLQRFKGKTTTLSKDGVHEVLGTKGVSAAYNPNQIIKEQTTSANKPKSSLGQNQNSNSIQETKNKTVKPAQQPVAFKANKTENPFLVSNPFYLDEEQRQREQIQRRQQLRIQQQTRKAEIAALNTKKDPKQITKTSNYSRSVEKKNSGNKQWTRLGGLGANIGGDEWVQKKKKLQKMQQFAGQVKNINTQKLKAPRPDIPKPKQQKQVNPRQKALEYSKNVPKPVIKRSDKQEEQEVYEQKRSPQNEGLTELQIYEMKHEQLKKMIHNQY